MNRNTKKQRNEQRNNPRNEHRIDYKIILSQPYLGSILGGGEVDRPAQLDLCLRSSLQYYNYYDNDNSDSDY